MLVDLHTHTVSSDGTSTISELIDCALSNGLTHLAVTDHDSIGSLKEFMRLAPLKGIFPISGIEFGCPYGANREVHILGYGFDFENSALNDVLENLRRSRKERFAKILDRLSKFGIEISKKEAFSSAKGALGRMHIARLMREKGYVASESEAFNLYIGDGKPAYITRESLSIGETVSLIRNAGGVCVLAHPGPRGLSEDDVKSIFLQGVEGLEVFYPEHSHDERKFFLSIALKFGKLVTGGSDFHGSRNGVAQSIGMGDYPEKYFKEFLSRIRS